MKELKEIIESFDKAVALGRKTALATVVKVEGSAYRREGGRMLITEDGQLTGAISGGCLEGDALRRALHVMVQQRPMVVTYDTTDDDHGFGLQLGCEGIVHLLIEPLNPDLESHPIAFFKAIFRKRQATAIATLYNLKKKKQLGTSCIFNEAGEQICSKPSISAEYLEQLNSHVQKVLQRRRSAFYEVEIKGELQTVFLEYLPKIPSLVVFGAGNDIRPVVEIADVLGWETTIIDGRPNLAKKERFNGATCVMVAKPDAALSQIEIDENTFFLLMTHNYNYDLAVLEKLLEKDVRYIGLLGPKKKFHQMLSDLSEKGILYKEDNLPHLFAPIGLDIGGSTPEAIALSIISEIQAVLSHREGGFLRNRDAPIHG